MKYIEGGIMIIYKCDCMNLVRKGKRGRKSKEELESKIVETVIVEEMTCCKLCGYVVAAENVKDYGYLINGECA